MLKLYQLKQIQLFLLPAKIDNYILSWRSLLLNNFATVALRRNKKYRNLKMKSIFSKHQNIINILFPIIITACIFYSGNIGQRISEIYTDYIIDTNTLNNSFITLNIKASIQDDESFQKIKKDIGEQMKQFNKKYEVEEKEKKTLEADKLWLDRVIYFLTFLLFIFNAYIAKQNVSIT